MSPRHNHTQPVPVPPLSPTGQAFIGLTDSQRISKKKKGHTDEVEEVDVVELATAKVVQDIETDPYKAANDYPALLILSNHMARQDAAIANAAAIAGRVEIQATKTNGRVDALEVDKAAMSSDVASLKSQRIYLVAFVAGIFFILSVCGFLINRQLFFMFKESVREIIKEEINSPAYMDKLKSALRYRKQSELAVKGHPLSEFVDDLIEAEPVTSLAPSPSNPKSN